MGIKLFLSGIIGLLLVVGIAALVKSTMGKKGKWGVNLKSTFCPACNTPAPTIRKPASVQEALWGGWTCSHCGCKIDKWGKEII